MAHTVLVVDDDPAVLMFLEEALTDRGFAVVSARGGGEALHMLGSPLYDIAVLVADIRIGAGVDGWEIARCAREISPALPIVYITGDSALAYAREGLPRSLLLQKPFSELALTASIHSLLRLPITTTAVPAMAN